MLKKGWIGKLNKLPKIEIYWKCKWQPLNITAFENQSASFKKAGSNKWVKMYI